MKTVAFEVAKAIKELGYPQYGCCEEYYNSEGWLVSKFCDIDKLVFPAPTYIEVWLWLWKEKCIKIDVTTYFDSVKGYKSLATILCYKYTYSLERDTPEDAIAAAIEHLVENDLIK